MRFNRRIVSWKPRISMMDQTLRRGVLKAQRDQYSLYKKRDAFFQGFTELIFKKTLRKENSLKNHSRSY